MSVSKTHKRRYEKTLSFVKKNLSKNSKILDLGIKNPFTPFLEKAGFKVNNTQGEDLDLNLDNVIQTEYDCVTSFEVFEHLLAPFNVLKEIKATKLIASVPLKLWFASAYWNETDDWDKHYHEFEKKQFDFLLKKTGWKIKDSELWTSPDFNKIGIRPFLRYFYPRYYIVYCERV